jgi:hypothetical protein
MLSHEAGFEIHLQSSRRTHNASTTGLAFYAVGNGFVELAAKFDQSVENIFPDQVMQMKEHRNETGPHLLLTGARGGT